VEAVAALSGVNGVFGFGEPLPSVRGDLGGTSGGRSLLSISLVIDGDLVITIFGCWAWSFDGMTNGARFFGDNCFFVSASRSFDGDEPVLGGGPDASVSSRDGPVMHEIIASPNTFRRQLPGALMDLS
jgi:hypothetical protein